MPKTATVTKSTRRMIPLDNEPLTPADLKAIREADEAFARGDYCTLDELEADLKADQAYLRAQPDIDAAGRQAYLNAKAGKGLSRAYDNADDLIADLHTAARRLKSKRRSR